MDTPDRGSGDASRWPPALTAASLGALCVYGWFAYQATIRETFGWEREVFRALYDGESPWPYGGAPRDDPMFERAMPLFIRISDARTLFALCLAIVVALLVARRLRGIAFFVAALAVNALNPLLKPLYARPSPFPLPGDDSFPSGHALASMSIAAAIVALLSGTRWRWPALVVAATFVTAVGIPIIADGGHWPTDVIAGWILAAVWVVTLALVLRDPLGPRFGAAARRRATPVAPARPAPPEPPQS